MRADYGLYIVAAICFIIVGLTILEAVPQYLPELMTFEGTVTTVVFSALGLIFAILGYALRPKPIIPIPEISKPSIHPTPPPVLPCAEETPTSSPLEQAAPTLLQQENAKPERKKPEAKTRRKGTGKRRKKA